MLRPAVMGDLPRLFEIVVETYDRTAYAARGIELSPNLTKALLLEGVRKSSNPHVGGTSLNVIDKDGVQAFMLGALQPVYHIGVGLEAQDVLLCASRKAPKLSPRLLVDSYLAWAEGNERVRDIYLSWTNIAGVDGKRLSRLYESRGFQRAGEIWKRGAR